MTYEPKPAELLDAKHDDPDPTGPLTDYEPEPTTAATDAQVAEVGRAVCDLADLIAKNRTGGAVFMGGEHLPRPSEERAAREFVADLLRRGWRLPDGE